MARSTCTVPSERITSTMSHHLKELRLAGLITTERSGKNIICRVNQTALSELRAYLAGHEKRVSGDECCCQPGPLLSITTKSISS